MRAQIISSSTRISLVALGSLTATGCAPLEDLKETVEGLTDRFVVQAIYLGLEEPETQGLVEVMELLDLEIGKGTLATAYLADAAEVNEIENAPITGAGASFLSASNGSLAMPEVSTGKYQVSSDGGLEYVDGEEGGISVTTDGLLHRISLEVPQGPEAGLEPYHQVGTPLVVNLAGQGFDTAMVIVVDIVGGSVTFSNQPENIAELYDFTHGNDGAVSVELPASTFPTQSIYGVGVAGMQVADTDTFEEVNTALSTFMAGKLRFSPVCTLEPSALCDE